MLDEGKRNVGFNLFEAIMESIDDAFDASVEKGYLKIGNEVRIYIYEEMFRGKINGNDIESVRFSYTIMDNGPGTKVDGVFDFGKVKENRYPNKFLLNNLNGIYHYGLVAHLNVANHLNFYSRELEKDWWLNSLEYNAFTKKAMSFQGKEVPVLNGNPFIDSFDNPDFTVRTLVHVRGVRKSVLGAANLKELEIKLTKQLGITYHHNIEQGKRIFVNNIEVVPLDPFMQEYNFVELGVESELFHSFHITLEELLEVEEDEIVKQEILNNFKHLFTSEKELLSEFISIDMFHLDLDIRRGSGPKYHITAKEPNVIMPSSQDSGFYIKRNLRYIGTAAKILSISTGHNTFNFFRGEISFSPIFDSFLGIQVNKNKYDIKSSLGTLIIKKIEGKVGNLQSYMVDYKEKKLNGKKPKHPVPIEDELNRKSEITRKRANHLSKVHAEAIELGVTGLVLNEGKNAIKTLYAITEELLAASKCIKDLRGLSDANKEEILKAENKELNLISRVEEVIKEADEVLTRLETAISTRNQVLGESATKLKQRVKEALSLNRRIIQTKDFEEKMDFQGFILEPLNEVELYGVLLTLIQHYQSEFDFVLLDYSENDHLDCLVKIKQSQVYDELNLRERFENQWDHDWDNQIQDDTGGFSFVELKYMLGDKKDLGHSLTLVSHLICWDFSKKNIEEFEALDGKYKISKDRNYLLHEDKRKKVKVICLKDYIKDLLGEEISVSSEKMNNYLNG